MVKIKHHNVGTIGEIIICTCLKISINSRIQFFWKGALRVFPLDGQIQGEVVVVTVNPKAHLTLCEAWWK